MEPEIITKRMVGECSSSVTDSSNNQPLNIVFCQHDITNVLKHRYGSLQNITKKNAQFH